MKLFPTIAAAWKTFAKNKKLLPIVVLIDILFLYGLTRLHYEAFNRASAHVLQLTAMMGQQMEELSSAVAPQLSVLESPEFISAYHQMLKFIAIFALGAFAVWVVGKGIVWLIAHKGIEKKLDLRQYALKFTGMTVFWFAAFVAITVIMLNLLNYTLFGVFPLISKTATNTIAVLVYWLLSYFISISYSLTPHDALKQTFALGVRRWRELLPVHIIGSLVFFVAATVPVHLIKLHIWLSLAFVVLIALPMMAWQRVFWTIAVHKVSRQVMKDG
jgi:hypothetical protein